MEINNFEKQLMVGNRVRVLPQYEGRHNRFKARDGGTGTVVGLPSINVNSYRVTHEMVN